MRWKTNKYGDTRIIKTFLFFPTTINNECRWLEKSIIEQEYCKYFPGEGEGWLNVKWVDE